MSFLKKMCKRAFMPHTVMVDLVFKVTEYEQKLLKQAEAFLDQTDRFKREQSEYKTLLDEYESYISKMEQKNRLSDKDAYYINQIISMQVKLKEAN